MPPFFTRNFLPKTGQTTVYTTNDDGTYKKGYVVNPRFVDNGNGTISDRATGLMWAKDGDGAGCNNGTAAEWSTSITACENCTLAGYTDWRMPNINELMSIVDWSTTSYINSTYFTNNKSSYYWSSTSKPNDTSIAGMFSFASGQSSNFQLKIDSYYVRAVRGGQ